MKFNKVSIENAPRVELHEALQLTGAEVTVNALPAHVGVPFVHAHKENEEIYIILDGEAKFVLDDEEVVAKKDDVIRVSKEVNRQVTSLENGVRYVCIQVKENSLSQYTISDAIIR